MTAALLRSVCVVMLAATSADLQREGRKPGPETGTIRGRIVAADTGAPIRDAIVSLRPADVVLGQVVRLFGPTRDTAGVTPSKKDTDLQAAALKTVRSARVDGNGAFELTDVVPGRYRLVVNPGMTAARYLPARYPDPASDDPAPLTIAAAQELDKIVIALPRAGAISGRVVDEHGSPMALVAIQAQEVLPGERYRQAGGAGATLTVRTDDLGAFRVFGLGPGEYILMAQPAQTTVLLADPGVIANTTTPVAPAYFPGTPSPAHATRIRVAPGEEHGPIEFTVARVRLLTVRGLLLDPGGQPVGHVNVSLRRQDASAQGSLQGSATRPDGTFELRGVAPGEYGVFVNRYSMDLGSQFAWMPVTIHDDIDGLTLRLQPGVTVNGQLLFEGTAPSPLPTMFVRSVPGRSSGVNSSGVAPNEDRSFTLENQFGPALLRIDGPSGWHLKTVLYGGRDVTDQPVEFVAAGGSVQIVLTQRGATLTGTVTAAASVPADARVMLFGEDPALWHDRASLTRGAIASATGRYRLDGLRPGRYLAVAVMIEDGAITGQGTAYFELLAKHATPVLLGDGESKTLDLKRVVLK